MDDKTEAVARAICKAALSSVLTYGDEICCQFAPASRRQDGCTNENVNHDGPLNCCWEDFASEAEAAIKAISK